MYIVADVDPGALCSGYATMARLCSEQSSEEFAILQFLFEGETQKE